MVNQVWLAPDDGDTLQVEAPLETYMGEALPLENGVIARTALPRQILVAQKILEAHSLERVIVFGCDCLVSRAPFDYLNEKYDGKLGVLWLDAHPDVSTPEIHKHVHAMVVGNLLGEGDLEFAAQVKVKLDPKLVMYGGLQEMSQEENAIINRLELRRAGPTTLAESSAPVLEWVKENQISHLAIHLNLDVLNLGLFRS